MLDKVQSPEKFLKTHYEQEHTYIFEHYFHKCIKDRSAVCNHVMRSVKRPIKIQIRLRTNDRLKVFDYKNHICACYC